jgi:hypothetical protein
MNCDRDKFDRDKSALVVRDRIKSPIRAIRIGGLPGSLDAVWPSGPWDPPRHRHDTASRCTRRALCFALKLTIRLSAIRAVSGKLSPCDHGVLAISDAA